MFGFLTFDLSTDHKIKEEGASAKTEAPSTNLLPMKVLPIYEVPYPQRAYMQIAF